MFSRVKSYWSRRRSDDEPSLIEIFKPLYIILLSLGLYPCSLTFPKGKYSKIEPKSIVTNSICAFVMITSSSIFLALAIYDRTSQTGSLKILDINYLIELVLLIASIIVSYFCVYFYRHFFVNMLNAVVLTWSELCNSDASHILKQFRFLIWVFIFGWLVLFNVVYIMLDCINSSSWLPIVSVVVSEMVPNGIVAFYNAMGLMVVSLLKNIEHQCGKLADNDKPRNIGFVRVKPKQPRITISQLELAYKKTLEMKRDLNTAFQAILLIITLQTFHTVLCESHALYRGVMKTSTYKAIDIVQSVHWILYQTLMMYAISFPGTMIENEENKIGQTLLCIPAESVQMFTEVQHFSSLMTYQETQMTAYGYFPLDATLVLNTFAAVATYLVILVQFDT